MPVDVHTEVLMTAAAYARMGQHPVITAANPEETVAAIVIEIERRLEILYAKQVQFSNSKLGDMQKARIEEMKSLAAFLLAATYKPAIG